MAEYHNKYSTFQALRKRYPFLAYEKSEISLEEGDLCIKNSFSLAGEFSFIPQLKIPMKEFFLREAAELSSIGNFAFQIGMIELISYWKSACPPLVLIRAGALEEAQVAFWKDLYFNGLGEFFFRNQIPADPGSFMTIIPESGLVHPMSEVSGTGGVLVPVGGGKDSAVTLELLTSAGYPVRPFMMNPRKAMLDTLQQGGFHDGQAVEFRRSIDPLLLELNEKGFLNGHTPFSALLAFNTLLAARLTGIRDIALSNEASANEATVPGSSVNHQYSKSFGFEAKFREYTNNYVVKGSNYFSFLRPLNEYQIALLFSGLPQYHGVFRSCNVGSKTDSWCGKCPKCLFACIILSPFLREEEVTGIFAGNLLEDPELLPYLYELAGISGSKPFECIGTTDEVNMALCSIIRKYGGKAPPYLLKKYMETPLYQHFSSKEETAFLDQVNPVHNLEPPYLGLLMDRFRRSRTACPQQTPSPPSQ